MASALKTDLDYLLNAYCMRLSSLRDMQFDGYDECESCLVAADKEQLLYFCRFVVLRYTIGIESGSLDVQEASTIVKVACKKFNGFRSSLFLYLAELKLQHSLGEELYMFIKNLPTRR